MKTWFSFPLLVLGLSVLPAGSPAQSADYRITRGLEKDANGVLTCHLASPFIGGEGRLRFLLPRDKTNKVVFLLPVIPWPDTGERGKRFGDGLDEVLKADQHNRHGFIAVAPDFPVHMPWFVDHATDPARRHESYIMKVVVPFVDQTLGLTNPQRDLVGFSKSANGALHLLLCYPRTFHACSIWDPAAIDLPFDPTPTNSLANAAGTAEQFARCHPGHALRENAAAFRDRWRIAIAGYSDAAFHARLLTLHRFLDEAKVPHRFSDQIRGEHAWFSGWLPPALAALTDMSPPTPDR
jgi:hypothetical protein